MEYTAIIEKTTDGWYIAHCAEIPNAHTQGQTLDEVKENLKEAIELILECEREIDILVSSMCKDLDIPPIQSH